MSASAMFKRASSSTDITWLLPADVPHARDFQLLLVTYPLGHTAWLSASSALRLPTPIHLASEFIWFCKIGFCRFFFLFVMGDRCSMCIMLFLWIDKEQNTSCYVYDSFIMQLLHPWCFMHCWVLQGWPPFPFTKGITALWGVSLAKTGDPDKPLKVTTT